MTRGVFWSTRMFGQRASAISIWRRAMEREFNSHDEIMDAMQNGGTLWPACNSDDSKGVRGPIDVIGTTMCKTFARQNDPPLPALVCKSHKSTRVVFLYTLHDNNNSLFTEAHVARRWAYAG